MGTKRKRKRFTPEFKAEVVIEALSGESSEAEVCRRCIYSWIVFFTFGNRSSLLPSRSVHGITNTERCQNIYTP